MRVPQTLCRTLAAAALLLGATACGGSGGSPGSDG